MFTKFPRYYELLLQWVWKNDLSYCLPSTQVLNLVAFKEQLKCGPPATAACHECLLRFAFEAGGALQWLSGIADIGHFSSQVTQYRLSQTLPWLKCNKHILQAQRCGYDQKSKPKNQLFWSCYSERSKAIKIHLASLFCSSCITALLANIVSHKAVIPTENPTQTFPQRHPCSVQHQSQLLTTGNARGELKTFSPTVTLLLTVPCLPRCHSLGWQWLLRCLSW